ncbi:MAG: SBBP repeat-containing protein, partial [Chloroflexia bacterium]
SDPAAWHTDVPLFSQITYRDLYNGIDLTYSGEQGRLKGTYTVAPGANPLTIAWRYEGTSAPATDEQGNLIITLNSVLSSQSSVLTEAAPVAWQEIEGERVNVPVGYTIRTDGSVSFNIGAYDPALPLVIDPTLTYSTYLGGNSGDNGYGIAVDTAHNIYITGLTASSDYPLQNPLQPGLTSQPDIFITKLNAAGNALVYSTYLGGNGIDWAKGIAVDGAGNVAVAGHTTSNNFPLMNPRQPTFGGGGNNDGFVLKLNPQGSALVFSTYLGGSMSDMAWGVDIDPAGNVYATGSTESTNFPTFNAIQPTYAGGESDAFITKYAANGLSYAYSTYLGGDLDFAGDIGYGIAADSAGDAYVTGETTSLTFPVANAMFPTYQGGESDAFVTKLNATGSAFIYSTYFGGGQGSVGTGADTGFAIAVDGAGNAYFAGNTDSGDFPTRNPIQPALNGFYDVFITKMNSAGSDLVYSTYIGGDGSGLESAHGIAVNAAGEAAVVGRTDSADFPVVNAVQSLYGGSIDAFALKLVPSGTAAAYVTFLGGSGSDYGEGAAIDDAGNLYATGLTASSNFPLANPYQDHLNIVFDIFISKISPGGGGTPTATRTMTPTPTGCAMGTRTVIILGSGFLPQNITVTVGTTVNWLNEGPAQHTTTSDTNIWDSGTLNPGQTFQFRFNTPGIYPYHCELHPNMVGNITVQPSTCTPSPVPTATGTMPAATRTATRTPTRTPTSTIVARSATPTAAGPTSTDTAVPPTSTAAITGTATAVSSATSEATATSTSSPTACAVQFADVPLGSTFYPFVRCLACRGIINGYNDGTFRPGNNVTRGQIAKIVANAAGFSDPAGAQQFEDVAPGSTFYDFVWRLADRGIISGYPCGGHGEPCGAGNLPYFRPNGNATRGQISKIASEAAGFGDPAGQQQFEDVLPDSTFFVYIYRLALRGIMNGYPCGAPGEPCGAGNLPYFRTGANATRGQLSKIAANTFFPGCDPPRR